MEEASSSSRFLYVLSVVVVFVERNSSDCDLTRAGPERIGQSFDSFCSDETSQVADLQVADELVVNLRAA